MTPRRTFRIVLLATLVLDAVVIGIWHERMFVHPLGAAEFALCFAAGFAAFDGPHFRRAARSAVGATVLATVLALIGYVVTGAAAADSWGPAKAYSTLILSVVASAAGTLLGGATASWRSPREA
ncbi:MAG: hypothetical protein JO306_06285 [Gemmatimonadetes bacterium]|nr:hypothetical protein [Gemmatimonadota bacterium]